MSWYAVEWIVHTCFRCPALRVDCPHVFALDGMRVMVCRRVDCPRGPRDAVRCPARVDCPHAVCVRWYACLACASMVARFAPSASMVCRPRDCPGEGLVCVSRLSRLRRWYACLAAAQHHAVLYRVCPSGLSALAVALPCRWYFAVRRSVRLSAYALRGMPSVSLFDDMPVRFTAMSVSLFDGMPR